MILTQLCDVAHCILQMRCGRLRDRTRRLAQVRRQAELEAFRLERHRAQVMHERVSGVAWGRSRSDSPHHRYAFPVTASHSAHSSPVPPLYTPEPDIPLAPIFAR